MLESCEHILNFERFSESKTISNVTKWMESSCVESHIMNLDFSQLTANGASNAIGSMQKFEVLTRHGRPNDVDFAVCYAHQNKRSGSKASRTVKFTEETNNDLGDVLKKSHEIQVRISRAPKRMHAYRQVQIKKECKPLLNPDPANETR
jgi:hypothetical protein